jgi:hypothetical protein
VAANPHTISESRVSFVTPTSNGVPKPAAMQAEHLVKLAPTDNGLAFDGVVMHSVGPNLPAKVNATLSLRAYYLFALTFVVSTFSFALLAAIIFRWNLTPPMGNNVPYSRSDLQHVYTDYTVVDGFIDPQDHPDLFANFSQDPFCKSVVSGMKQGGLGTRKLKIWLVYARSIVEEWFSETFFVPGSGQGKGFLFLKAFCFFGPLIALYVLLSPILLPATLSALVAIHYTELLAFAELTVMGVFVKLLQGSVFLLCYCKHNLMDDFLCMVRNSLRLFLASWKVLLFLALDTVSFCRVLAITLWYLFYDAFEGLATAGFTSFTGSLSWCLDTVYTPFVVFNCVSGAIAVSLPYLAVCYFVNFLFNLVTHYTQDFWEGTQFGGSSLKSLCFLTTSFRLNKRALLSFCFTYLFIVCCSFGNALFVYLLGFTLVLVLPAFSVYSFVWNNRKRWKCHKRHVFVGVISEQDNCADAHKGFLDSLQKRNWTDGSFFETLEGDIEEQLNTVCSNGVCLYGMLTAAKGARLVGMKEVCVGNDGGVRKAHPTFKLVLSKLKFTSCDCCERVHEGVGRSPCSLQWVKLFASLACLRDFKYPEKNVFEMFNERCANKAERLDLAVDTVLRHEYCEFAGFFFRLPRVSFKDCFGWFWFRPLTLISNVFFLFMSRLTSLLGLMGTVDKVLCSLSAPHKAGSATFGPEPISETKAKKVVMRDVFKRKALSEARPPLALFDVEPDTFFGSAVDGDVHQPRYMATDCIAMYDLDKWKAIKAANVLQHEEASRILDTKRVTSEVGRLSLPISGLRPGVAEGTCDVAQPENEEEERLVPPISAMFKKHRGGTPRFITHKTETKDEPENSSGSCQVAKPVDVPIQSSVVSATQEGTNAKPKNDAGKQKPRQKNTPKLPVVVAKATTPSVKKVERSVQEKPIDVSTLQVVDPVTAAPLTTLVKKARKKKRRKGKAVKSVEKAPEPCFQHFIGGGCSRNDCGYSHTVPDGTSVQRVQQKVAFVSPSISESKVSGSNPADLSFIAYFRSDEPNKPFSGNGYLRQFQNTLHFITHRHSIDVSDSPCVVDDYCGDSIRGQLLGRDGKLVDVTLVEPRGDKLQPDKVAWIVRLEKGDVMWGVGKAEFHHGNRHEGKNSPGIKESLLFTYYDDAAFPSISGWCSASGGVRGYTHHGKTGTRGISVKLITSEISTVPGCCRAVYLDRAGRIVGCHRWSSTKGLGNFPAMEVEYADLPSRPLATIPNDLKWKEPDFARVSQGIKYRGLGNMKVVESESLIPVGTRSRLIVNPDKYSPKLSLLKKELVGCNYLVAKPGADSIETEVLKFGGENKHTIPEDVLDKAWSHVMFQDLKEGVQFYRKPTVAAMTAFIKENFKYKVDDHGLCWEDSEDCTSTARSPNAGSRMPGKTHQDVFEAFRKEYPNHEPEHVLADFVVGAFEALANGDDGTRPDSHTLLHENWYWMVSGKRDRYSLKKVKQGDSRSIQMPSFQLKIMHKWCFGDADAMWTSSDSYRVGADNAADLSTISSSLEAVYRKAVGVSATDVTGWDRRLPASLMETYFMRYLKAFSVGVPDHILKHFCNVTVNSILYLPNGKLYQKDSGNPSGYMNTLRLNTVILRVVDLSFAMMTTGLSPAELEQHRFFEGCGDDARVHYFDEIGKQSCTEEYLKLWAQHTPWVVKVEGSCDYEAGDKKEFVSAPPFISRQVIEFNGKLFTPLCNPDRLVSKLLYKSSVCLSERVIGTCVAMDFLIVAHIRGFVFCPAVDFLFENFSEHVPLKLLENMFDKYAGTASDSFQKVYEVKSETKGSNRNKERHIRALNAMRSGSSNRSALNRKTMSMAQTAAGYFLDKGVAKMMNDAMKNDYQEYFMDYYMEAVGGSTTLGSGYIGGYGDAAVWAAEQALTQVMAMNQRGDYNDYAIEEWDDGDFDHEAEDRWVNSSSY